MRRSCELERGELTEIALAKERDGSSLRTKYRAGATDPASVCDGRPQLEAHSGVRQQLTGRVRERRRNCPSPQQCSKNTPPHRHPPRSDAGSRQKL
ncbi:unnamed protein product [Vitrella brassicaformis CCMP3155]|uniref:Uncharacterized protein n=1 Tax=Vitrella brassicaformis (strain CCMP3155) TaxID=1169540 RepID=A0A0G4EQV5_VITBC|nr:unnamed protein product [Vitrella brassicaformis CCMP3155]|eukprot:CEL99826.1 unnamed protein product [Vitrella brassicaformis CCMP3155]